MTDYDELMRQANMSSNSGNNAFTPTAGYGLENPANWRPDTQFNTGIGSDWFKNQDEWRNIYTKEKGYDPLRPAGGGDGDPAGAGKGGAGWAYTGDDGRRYVIKYRDGNLVQVPTDQEVGNPYTWNPDAPAANKGWTVSALHQDNSVRSYNGIPHDLYDDKGKYLNTQVSNHLGHEKFWRDAALVAAMVGTAGLAGYGMAGAGAAGAGGGGAAAGGGGAAAGGGGWMAGVSGEAVAGAGMGAGEVAAGGAAAGGAGASAGGGGVGAGEAVGGAGGLGSSVGGGSGAPVTDLSSYGGGSLSQSGGGWDALARGLTNTTGTSDLLKLGMSLASAYSSGKGQEVETTSTKELPEWLQQPVYGQGGLIPQSNWLLGQQMNGTSGPMQGSNTGLLRVTDKRAAKKKAKRGLL